jgi:ribose/xylose/arabinose/galactoside ABC-type transport system permease subunit/ABC-type sugar transport system substrate-binding protein
MSDTIAVPNKLPAARGRYRIGDHLTAFGPLIALVVLLIIGGLINESFLSSANLSNVLTRSALIGIIAIGTTFVITAGGLDLSVGAMSALVAGLMIMFMNFAAATLGTGWATVLAGIAFALVLGTMAGLVNGLLITRWRIEAFIVTLGTMGIFRSLLTYLSNGGSISLESGLRSTARPIYYGTLLGIAYPIIALAVLAAIGEFVLWRTRFGRHCAAVGSNADVARYSAINVNRVRIATYILQGLCVAVATLIYVPRLGAATPSTGVLWELEAIAAVIIGGTVLSGGYGRIWGTIVGVLILGLIQNVLNLTSWFSPHLNGSIQGAIIILAVPCRRDGRLDNQAYQFAAREEDMLKNLRSLLSIGAITLAGVLTTSPSAMAEKAKIGVSIPAATHGWTGGLNYHTKRTVDALKKAYPDLEFVITTADSATKQVNDIEDLVAVQKINALVVLPFESDPLTEPVKEAKKQGVFVATVDRGLSEEGIEDLYVGGNNPEYGRIAADYFKKKLDGKGKIVVMRGIPTAIDNIRIDAFKKALEGTSIQVLDMQYANWNPDKGFEVMQDYLQRFPQIDAVWAGDDDAALGAVEAINQAGRAKGMTVLGGSGMNKVIKRIMDGDSLFDADIFYPPTLIIPAIGAVAMKFAVGAPVSGRWVLGSPLITKENAKQYYFPESPY